MHPLASLPTSALLLILSLTASATASTPYSSPLRLHLDPEYQSPALSPLSLFRRAQTYQCNPGTFSCEAIGQSQFCCNNGETCHKIPDIGYGSVGCCPAGSTCSGNLSGCGEDKVTCIKNVGGGCCNKGSMCTRRGCIVDPAIGAKIQSEAPVDLAPNGAGLGAVGGAVGAGDSGAAKTVTVQTMTTTVPASTLCDEGWRACAVAAGGGCCPDGYNCGVRSCPAKIMVVTELVNGVPVTATAQMPAMTKRAQNIFVPVTGDAVDMRGSAMRWVLAVPVAVGLAVGGALVI